MSFQQQQQGSSNSGSFLASISTRISEGLAKNGGIIGMGITYIIMLVIIGFLLYGITTIYTGGVATLYPTRLKQELVAVTFARVAIYWAIALLSVVGAATSAFWGTPRIYAAMSKMWEKGGNIKEDSFRFLITLGFAFTPILIAIIPAYMLLGLSNAVNNTFSFLRVDEKVGTGFTIQRTPEDVSNVALQKKQ